MVTICYALIYLILPSTCRRQDHVMFQIRNIDSHADFPIIRNSENFSDLDFPRGKAQDAQFLIQATFGPTHSSLSGLANTGYAEWIQQQISLPVELHREYYRSRVNPHFVEESMDGFSPRPPCMKGSRWHSLAFVHRDVYQGIEVANNKIHVNGVFRTNIETGALPSRWSRFRNEGFLGYICSVIEAPGADVTLSPSSDCKSDKIDLPNPNMWLKEQAEAVETDWIFVRLKPGILLLDQDVPQCSLADSAFIRASGRVYRHDIRVQLLQNTPQNPALGSKASCMPKTFLNEEGCRLNPIEITNLTACLAACGSPGEVSNNAALGHQFPIYTMRHMAPDNDYDNKYYNRMASSLSKSTVWTMKALQANDQLRQRMAWALSQIFVASVPGYGDDHLTESWLCFYDIFVRHAFGNFRNILREVTYSPLMGSYLTYKGSKSFDRTGKYPDENYAREIMQLFTIGLDKLYPNGTSLIDATNGTLPTYSNENIMDFSRVFTGFVESSARSNIEVRNGPDNRIDPMRMDASRHDRYPKPDLDGGYLGDGYPLCADIPPGAFLMKGATYEFFGYTYEDERDAVELSASSELYAILCGGVSDTCAFRLTVELEANVACFENECVLDTPQILKVASGFYEYKPPACVHLFFYNGQSVVKGNEKFSGEECANPDIQLAGVSCCGGCSNTPTGYMANNGYTCDTWTHAKTNENRLKDYCNKDANWVQRNYCQMSCWELGLGYSGEKHYADNCSTGDYREARPCVHHHEYMRFSAARARCDELNMDVCPGKTAPGDQCGYSDAEKYVWLPKTCTVDVEVHDDGKISAHTATGKQNRFAALWFGAAIPKGSYATYVEARPVFASIPTKQELQGKLSIGAFPPRGDCIQCEGEVKAYSAKSSTAYMDNVLESNPAVYLRLDDQVGPSVVCGNSNNAAVTDLQAKYVRQPALAQPGLAYSLGSSVFFDGTRRQAVEISSHALINKDEFAQKTIELWFLAHSVSGSPTMLWNQGGRTRGLNMYLDGNLLVLNAWNLAESNWGPISVSTSINAGTRYHVALVLDGDRDGNENTDDGTLSGFLNGVAFGSKSGAGILRSHGTSSIACCKSSGKFANNTNIPSNSAFFTGTIDDVAIYNTALGADELTAHYEATLVRIDAETVFESEGKYFKNVESVVRINGADAFRNPPVFLRSGPFLDGDRQSGRAALAEVESLLDHLLHHGNTPVFIGRKLIQRFVTSNPSSTYLEAVGRAFKKGHYGGQIYSGKYGDLGAALAATLLHPEARTDSADSSRRAIQGGLREPLLKIIHIMRSMNYVEQGNDQIVFEQLQEIIGQFPFQSPSVFNFYMADYEPPRFSDIAPEPEPEPEAEPEGEPELEPVAPEFQIFTPPYFMGFLNGMTSLIYDGISHQCGGRDGIGISVHSQILCKRGELAFEELGSINATLEELNALLTGGRLTPKTFEMLRSTYESAAEGDRIKVAQQMLMLTPEFHTMGAVLPLEGTRPVPTILEHTEQRPYRATIILFMFGGADTFNMLVPQECDLWREYMQVRDDIALTSAEVLKVSTSGQDCSHFGVHRSLSFVKALYESGSAAFVSNIGSLVEPLTENGFRSGQSSRCRGLFSHSHQQTAAQTLQCQTQGSSPRGAGGRLADALTAGRQQLKTTSFSLAGNSVWSQGIDTHTEIIDKKQGAVRFGDYERSRHVIRNVSAQLYGNVYADEYTQALLESIESSERIGSDLESVELATEYQTDSSLQKQLHQVARLIKARDRRHAERDLFFVEMGGWDMHSDLRENLGIRLKEVDDAIQGFVAELQAQEIFDSVVLATESDFGRTLTSNGGGSDHGWAGQHIILGGSIQGGKVFNQYPASLVEGNEQDAGRGRLIPKFPWESMLAPIAEWMGLEASLQGSVFPNLQNFNASYIISKNSLFKDKS